MRIKQSSVQLDDDNNCPVLTLQSASSQIINECKSTLKTFDNPIALHIRRGDFLINSANHHNLPMSYYENGLDCFDEDRQVVIFSDDPEWCFEQKLFDNERQVFILSQQNLVSVLSKMVGPPESPLQTPWPPSASRQKSKPTVALP